MSEFSVSQIYDGKGTTNALQVALDLDAAINLVTQPTAISTGNFTGIELFLSVAADDKSPVIVCINHSSAAIALDNIIHIQEDVVSAADMAFKVDRSIWGLAATTDYEPKRLVYFPCAPNSYVSIVAQSVDGSAVYCRYRLTQMHTAAAGGVGAAEGGAATEAKQDTQEVSLDAIQAALGPYAAGAVENYYNAAQLADAGNQTIDTAAGASNTQYVIALVLSVKQECWWHLQDEDDAVIYGPFYTAADGTIVLPAKKAGEGKGYYCKNNTNKALEFSHDSGHAVDYSLDIEWVTTTA